DVVHVAQAAQHRLAQWLGAKGIEVEVVDPHPAGSLLHGLDGEPHGPIFATKSALGSEKGRIRRIGRRNAADPQPRHDRPAPRVSGPMACCAAADRLAAELMMPMWLKACGKFPTIRLASVSYSSASRPTSLRNESRRSKSCLASSSRPISTRLSTNQKV